LTFVVFVREFGNLSELVITRNAPLGVVFRIAATILPPILIFSLPLSYLIGVLIGLSGLSGESQITALRACGVPLRTLLRPIILLGSTVGLLTFVCSVFLLPRTNEVLHRLKDRISLRQATSQLQPRVFNEGFSDVVIYLDDLNSDRQSWSRIFLSDSSDRKAPRTVLAGSGTWVTDATGRRLQLHLQDGVSYEIDPDDPSKDNVSLFASTDISIDLGGGIKPESETAGPTKVVELSTGELWRSYDNGPAAERTEKMVELNRRIALPFSVFPFALLGLTLGASAKKGGRTSGFVLGLVGVVLFYSLFFNGLRLASVGRLQPWLGAWGADILLGCLGMVLLVKAERGFTVGYKLATVPWESSLAGMSRRLHLPILRSQIARIQDVIGKSAMMFTGFQVPRILDLYVAKGFFVYFFWSLISCGTLFVLFTLFDLLDDIIRNKVMVSYLIGYFAFLTPQILMLVVPMSVLLAILINFGILEKNSEITAVKAGGGSLYRIAVPIVFISAGLCGSMYLIQDYLLPYANIRQDSLRNMIKGRPPQTSKKPQRKWIFGDSGRIYNYEYFDGGRDSFVDLNIYETDLRAARILRRIHAARATANELGEWTLEDGWIRDFQAQHAGFERIKKAVFHFSEKPGYFEKEIFQPKESSKLTYSELRKYINYLRASGYNATELQVEIHKKISFPLSCLIMTLLGLPFSFSTGKKGAFFGIGLSIGIAMSYWAAASFFEEMGAYGLLTPVLAAWAPNMLFGAAGLILLFTIRT